MRTSLGTISPPESFSRATTSVISLGQVRSGPRTTNEYVEGPRAQPLLPLKTHLISAGGGSSSPGIAQRVNLHSRVGEGNNVSPRPTFTSPVVSQPSSQSPPLKKEPVHSLDVTRNEDAAEGFNNHVAAPAAASHSDSIICDQCGKCRCSACTEPRSLPSQWCCHNACEISPDKALDVCTCFCCVKCVFYHCGAEEDNDCYENPCGCCSTPQCCQRWTLMGLMSLCLPCLWTYWPAKACLAGCTMCYNHCCHKGCQCREGHESGTPVISGRGDGRSGCVNGRISFGSSKSSQTRRLLIDPDSCSS